MHYLGRLVEIGDHQAVYERAAHPYTQALLAAVPSMDLDRRGARAPVRITNASRETAQDVTFYDPVDVSSVGVGEEVTGRLLRRV